MKLGILVNEMRYISKSNVVICVFLYILLLFCMFFFFLKKKGFPCNLHGICENRAT